MIPPLQTIRLSKSEVDVLNILKRRTKIYQWNVLCRMAFCLSCQDQTEPSIITISSGEGNVELDWDTFCGQYSEIYSAICMAHKYKTRSKMHISEYFKNLLFRGIMRLKDIQR